MNKKLIVSYVSIVLLITSPFFSLAFNPGNVPNSVSSLTINQLIDIIFSFIWPIVIAIIIIAFLGVGLLFLLAQGDPTKINQARLAFIGVVVITVIVVLSFSIPFIIRNALGL